MKTLNLLFIVLNRIKRTGFDLGHKSMGAHGNVIEIFQWVLKPHL